MSKLPDVITTILESSLNRYLALDPASGGSLDRLENKVIALKIKEFSFPLYYKIQNRQVTVLASMEEGADVSMQASIFQLIKLTTASDDNQAILGDDIEMSGDIDVGRQFRDIFRNLDIDWEEIASRYTGDVIAHKVGSRLRKLNQWLGNTGQSIQSDIAEYLQEESQHLPAASEVRQFVKQVDDVRLSVDRLEARINLLKNKLEK